jgi:tRNA-splicing ligase RtcB (3'-phosphate/5'-hydroxy nucleic acid ligase)
VHRKGATRALPAGAHDLPADLADVGQPVLIPGSMGTASHVLVGTRAAGRSTPPRTGRDAPCRATGPSGQAHGGAALRDELAERGIEVRAGRLKDLPEEAPYAYKDVDEVVDVCHRAGLGRRVARLRPIGVVKG